MSSENHLRHYSTPTAPTKRAGGRSPLTRTLAFSTLLVVCIACALVAPVVEGLAPSLSSSSSSGSTLPAAGFMVEPLLASTKEPSPSASHAADTSDAPPSLRAFAPDSKEESLAHLTPLQLLQHYHEQQNQQYMATSFNDYSPIFNPQCFKAAHYQSQFNALLIRYLKKHENIDDMKALDDFLEWRGYDHRAEACNLTLILREVDTIQTDFSTLYTWAFLEKSFSKTNIKYFGLNAFILFCYIVSCAVLTMLLPLRTHARRASTMLVGFFFACTGTFFLDNIIMSFIGLTSLSYSLLQHAAEASGVRIRDIATGGVSASNTIPAYRSKQQSTSFTVKVMTLITCFLWMCAAIQLHSKVMAFGFALFVHLLFTYVGYNFFWTSKNRALIATGNVLMCAVYSFNVLHYILMHEGVVLDVSPQDKDLIMLGDLFAKGWKWCAVASFTSFWCCSLFAAGHRALIRRKSRWNTIVVFFQSLVTMTVIALFILYGRYVSDTFNVYQAAAFVLAASLVVFVRKNMNDLETLAVALYVGLIGYAVHVFVRYKELGLILALSR